MNRNTCHLMIGAGAIAMAAGMAESAIAAPPADWSKVPTKVVKLFYPGIGGYQWLRSPSHKRADKKVIAGDSCVSCHEGEEADIGNLIVSGEKLEPAPIKGKNGVIDFKIQAAFDSENLYFRFQWPTNAGRPGDMHNYMRFDGEMGATCDLDQLVCCPRYPLGHASAG